jgi:Flp pilus assembly pilin Flp
MTRNNKTFLRRFVQDESGVLLVPFVMWSVLILGLTV